MSTSPSLGGEDLLRGTSSADVLVFGIDLDPADGRVEALKRLLPEARFVSLSDHPVDRKFERASRASVSALRVLNRTRPRAVVAVQDYQKLRALALLVPAPTHLVVRDGELRPIEIREVGRRQLSDLKQKLLRATGRDPEAGLPDELSSPIAVGNDYSFLEQGVRRLPPGWPRLRVSVLVPVHDRRSGLEKTLTALAHQTYPKRLFEVLVADGGGFERLEGVVAGMPPELSVRVLRQEDRVFRAAAARNRAIRAATGDVIVCLDCDLLPTPGFLVAHLRWFHAAPTHPVVVLGYGGFADQTQISAGGALEDHRCFEQLPDLPAPNSARDDMVASLDWRIPRSWRTRMLKTERAPYALAGAGNMSFSRKLAVTAGLFDETFERRGGADVEFAYRLYRRGAWFVSDPEATAFRHDRSSPVNRIEDQKLTCELLGRRVPHWREHASDGPPFEAPKVSVYVPAHDAAEWIERTVKSALAQTLRDLEVCVCDDGSTDDTLRVLEQAFPADPRVRWVSQENGGIGAASNAAVEMCRGEYILQLDADDELLPSAAEELAAELDADPELSLVYGGFEICDPSKTLYERRQVLPQPYDPFAHLHGNVATHPRMFRARDFYRTSGFDETLENAVDFDIYLKLAEVGRVRPVPKVLYRYYIHGKNTSVARREQQFQNHVRVAKNALIRRGLDWEVTAPDPSNPRRILFRRPRRGIRRWF